jgi:hypothetical protein
VNFLECADCGEALRLLEHELRRDGDLAAELAAEKASFEQRHASCRVHRWAPDGETTSDLPLLEPLGRRSIRVRGLEDASLRGEAQGAREEPDGPLAWRIVREEGPRVSPSPRLDGSRLLALAERALEGGDGTPRSIPEWAVQLELVLSRLPGVVVASPLRSAGRGPDGGAAHAPGPEPGAPESAAPASEHDCARDQGEGVQLLLALAATGRPRPSPERASTNGAVDAAPEARRAPGAG